MKLQNLVLLSKAQRSWSIHSRNPKQKYETKQKYKHMKIGSLNGRTLERSEKGLELEKTIDILGILPTCYS